MNATETFNNLTINSTSSKIITAGDTLIATGTLTLVDGTINTGTLEAHGSISHGAAFDGGTATLNVTQGSSDINLTVGGELPAFNLSTNRVINGPASGSVNFDGLFTMSAGTYTGGAGEVVFTGGITVSGGSFNGGSGSMDVKNNFTLSGVGAAFTATSGNMYVSGGWTHTGGGTFSANGGSITFDGSTVNVDVEVTETFYNLELLQATNAVIIIGTGDTLIVPGTLSLNQGGVNVGTIEAQGDVTHSSVFNGGSGTVLITGASERSIDLVAGGQLPALTLNAEDVTVNGPVAGTVTFDGLFTIADGSYIDNGADLILSAGLTVSGGTYTGSSGNLSFPNSTCNLTVTGGTFSGGSGTIDVNGVGGFTLSGADTVFTSTSGTLSVVTNWTHTDSSTFIHNSGTVLFDNTSTRTTDVNTSETFYNLTLAASNNSNRVVASGDTLIVLGALTLTDGQLSTGTIEARGDVIHGAGFDGGTGTLHITQGVSDINLTDGGQLPIVDLSANRTINGSGSGTVTFDGTFTLENGSLEGGAGNLMFSGNLTVSGGSFSGGSGDVTVVGSTTLSSPGSFISTSGNLTLYKDWIHTDSSVFDHNSGTVTLRTLNYSVDVNTSENFYNLTFSANDGSIRTISPGDTLVVEGLLTLNDGKVNTGTLSAQGDVLVASTFDGGTAPLFFSGSATQAFDLDGATSLYDGDITINKSGGQVDLDSGLVLDATSQDLTIQEGKLSLAGHDLTVNGTSSVMTIEDGGHLQLQGGETLTFATAPTFQTDSTTTFTGNGDAGANTYTLNGLSSTFGNLILNATDGASDTFQLSSALDINGDFTLTAGTLDVVSGQNYGVSVAGDWAKASGFVFLPQAGTVTLDGDSQIISGTNTFYGLTKYGTVQDSQLVFPAGVTTTVTGLLALSSSSRLHLESSTPGVQASLDPQGDRWLSSLNVQDSDNVNLLVATCRRCVDGGNNANWQFNNESGTPVVPPEAVPTITLLTPEENKTLTANQPFEVRWDSNVLAEYYVEFALSVDGGSTYDYAFGPVPNSGQTWWTVPAHGGTSLYLRATLTDLVNEQTVDSIGPFTIALAEVPKPLEPSDPEPETDPDTVSVEAGSYVKISGIDTVYYIDSGFVRHPIPDAQTYFTYATSWTSVKVVALGDLVRNTVLGSPLPPKAGTVLVKIASAPEVYALTLNDQGQTVIHWLPSESVAQTVYGPLWADYVIDIDVTLWPHFIVGDPVVGSEMIDLGIMKKRVDLHK